MRQPSLFQAPSEWIPPENIPNLEEATEIAIDLETHDPGLSYWCSVGRGGLERIFSSCSSWWW